jgi:transcriptional regulator with XRE-family HTH domain
MAGRRAQRVKQYRSRAYRSLQQRLADNVRRVRFERGYTQEACAECCQMPTRLLQRVEAGDVNATLTTLARLCDGLGIDIGLLLKR